MSKPKHPSLIIALTPTLSSSKHRHICIVESIIVFQIPRGMISFELLLLGTMAPTVANIPELLKLVVATQSQWPLDY